MRLFDITAPGRASHGSTNTNTRHRYRIAAYCVHKNKSTARGVKSQYHAPKKFLSLAKNPCFFGVSLCSTPALSIVPSVQATTYLPVLLFHASF